MMAQQAITQGATDRRSIPVARLFLAPVGGAALCGVDTAAAARMDGVRAVLCGRDTPALARQADFAGAALAMVIADTGPQAEAALRSLRVDLDVPAPVIGIAAAVARNQCVLDRAAGDGVRARAARDESDHIVTVHADMAPLRPAPDVDFPDLAALTQAAQMAVNGPVHLLITPDECAMAATARPDQRHRVTLAANPHGEITALIHHIEADAGARPGTLDGLAQQALSCGAGLFENSYATFRGFASNGPVTTGCTGQAEAAVAIHQAFDRLAEKLGLDPLELWGRNLAPDMRGELNRAARFFDWQGGYRGAALDDAGRLRRGEGLAVLGGQAAFAEAIVDTQTGLVMLPRCLVAQPPQAEDWQKTPQNPPLGGVMRALERVVNGFAARDRATGAALATSLTRYHRATAFELPDIRVVPLACKAGPFIADPGDLVEATVSAALANAVADATGVTMTRLPLAPQIVCAAMKNIEKNIEKDIDHAP